MQYEKEKTILVGITLQNDKEVPLEESMQEMVRLVDTAGGKVIFQASQKRERPDSKFFMGKGKVEEVKAAVAAHDADVVIIDHEISPSQQRNLEKALETRVIDRTALILDIFSLHAQSREGKIQVELAKLEYQLPRLSGMWEHLSRQRGGIGLRDVGEKQIEIDRRIIQKRILAQKKEIEKIRRDRSLRRAQRKKSNIPNVALVGYTNAGKSTLLNTLSKSNVLTEDKLFATLDPTIRRVYFPGGKVVLLSDTVGFIQKLPHQLVAAFRATLEEVTESDFLVHVVDASHTFFEDQIQAVYTVLEELECASKPMLTVFNKIDIIKNGMSEEILQKYKPAVAISAKNGVGLDKLEQILSSLST